MLFFFLTCHAFAQRKDFSIRENISLEKKIMPKMIIDFKQGSRLSQNASQFKYIYFDMGITYKISKKIQTSLDYRFINKQSNENLLSKRHRIYWTLCYKLKLKPFILSYRHIMQSQVQDIYSSENGDIPIYYSRSKISIKYELARFTPFIATELYSNIIHWSQLEPNKLRLFIGSSYMLDKINELELYYEVQKDLNVITPWTNYIIGIGFTHKFY